MKDDRIYLLHIQEAIQWIERYAVEGREFFLQDRKTQDAVLRNLEVVGEAVKNISQKLKSDRPDIPWKQISGTRDKLIHEYFGVDLELVWDVVEKNLPELHSAVQDLLMNLNSG